MTPLPANLWEGRLGPMDSVAAGRRSHMTPLPPNLWEGRFGQEGLMSRKPWMAGSDPGPMGLFRGGTPLPQDTSPT